MGSARLIFGREPAAWIGLVSVALTLLAAFGLPLSDGQTGAVLAVVTAAAALFVAWAVQPVAPALFLGLGKAVMALVLAFGLHLDATQQGAIMAAATVVLTLVLRQQVTPPVPVAGEVRTTVSGVTFGGTVGPLRGPGSVADYYAASSGQHARPEA